MSVEVTDASFAEAVLAADRPVIVDFWAPWCGPCQAIEPVLEALAAERGAELARVNVDENVGAASRYGVLSLPTVVLFAGGEPRATVIGARRRGHYERAFAEWLPSAP